MSDLQTYFEGHISIPEFCKSANNDGPAIVGKIINELLMDTSDEDFKAVYAWLDYSICELLQKGLEKFNDRIRDET